MGVGEIMRDFDRKKHELSYCSLTFVVLILAFVGWVHFSPVIVDCDSKDLIFKWSVKLNQVN